MNRETVMAMAHEADLWMSSDDRIAAVERFAALVEAHERKQCAQDCLRILLPHSYNASERAHNAAIEACADIIARRP